MRPDAQRAMRTALSHGPDHCPPDLFAGSTDRVLLGLKAHANTISHARHVALEDSFPRTRALLGADRFHALAADYLQRPAALALPHAHIGRDFPGELDGAAQDMARLEWAWLEAHGATDAPAFDLDVVAGQSAETLVATPVLRHPAARLVTIDNRSLQFDGVRLFCRHVLLTRPALDVAVASLGAAGAKLFRFLDQPRLFGDLLEIDAAAATGLVSCGALTQIPEIML